MISDAKAAPRTLVPHLENPGAAINDNHTITDEEENESTTTAKAPTMTLKDMEDVLANIFDR